RANAHCVQKETADCFNDSTAARCQKDVPRRSAACCGPGSDTYITSVFVNSHPGFCVYSNAATVTVCGGSTTQFQSHSICKTLCGYYSLDVLCRSCAIVQAKCKKVD